MQPFFEVFGLSLSSYGVMMVVALASALAMGALRANACGVARSELLRMGLIAIAGGLLGAKALYLLISIPSLMQSPALLRASLLSGFVFFGGLIGGVAAAMWYARQMKLAFWRYADAAAPCLAFAHAVGRIGCFMAGCCYGHESAQFGLYYPASISGPRDIPLLPTQLYECAALLVICAVLIIVQKKLKFSGQLFGLYIVLYTVSRFVMEFLRGDVRGGFLCFSSSQWICLLLLPVSAILLFFPMRIRAFRKNEAAA